MPPDLAARPITITRVFDAAPERVWRAWTEPAEIARWWGRRGWSTPPESVVLDPRPGGRFSLNSINDEDGREMPQEAVFREVEPFSRLVFEGRNATGEVTFRDLGDGRTEMTFHTTMRSTEEVRDRAAGGLASAFDRLAETLAAGGGPPTHASTPPAGAG